MFFRNSQYSKTSKLSRRSARLRSQQPNRISRQISYPHRSSYRQTMPSELPPLSTSEVSAAPLTKERSQSWQIAPNLFTSFKYAWAGISYAFQTQRNFRIHTGVGTIALLLCWILRVSNVEVAIVCLTCGAVLVMEILNTALESLVDLTVGQTYHELAKIAKDCAAGAVLMAAIVALIIAILIFAPLLWTQLNIYLAASASVTGA